MSSMALFIALLHECLHNQLSKPWTNPGTAHQL